MNLLILAAGYAVRLHPHSLTTPKPLLDVGGVPMVEHVLRRMAASATLDRAVLVSNARFHDAYAGWIGTFARSEGIDGIPLPDLINDGSTAPENKLGAIGDLRLGMREGDLYGDDLVVIGGDNLFELPQPGFIGRARPLPAAIATADVGSPENVRRFASLETDGEGRLTAFIEKPAAPTGTIAGTALYYFRRETLPLIDRYVEEGNHPDNAGYLFQWLFPRIPTYAFPIDGRWFDIGDADTLAEARRAFGDRTAGWTFRAG